ncbi:MAG TPA: cytochrome c [Bacteroidia bacterium]
MKRLSIFLFAAMISSCAVKNNSADTSSASQYSGLTLWQKNCSRCHNSPSPGSFSDAEWDVIGSHMRVRAYLTGKETNEIIKFLKSIN